MRIRVAVQNVMQGALRDGEGEPEHRWPQLVARLAAVEPDVLLINEARGWADYGHRQLGRAQHDLGMLAVPLPASKTGMLSVIMFRPDTMGWWDRAGDDLGQETVHGFVTATFTVAGLPVPVTFAAAHLDPYSPDKAVQEAKLVATRAYRYGPYAVVGGDMNYPPEAGPEPDYTQMRPYNLAARTLPGEPGAAPRPNRRVGEEFRRCGYLDAAWHLHERTGDEALLRRTASDDRIDRIHVSGPFAAAISNYQLLDEPAGASDHHGVAVDIDTARVAQDNLWSYQ